MITLPLAEGTLERIDALRANGEVRLDFIRAAIDREIGRRVRDDTASRRFRVKPPAIT
ncbi:hypothetical protein [Azospirillum sp. B4]|uniref:hypothetical protein n=1 Tax=Azospirillum sp. B4 TaxID=95605 RepID=UPI00131EDFBB|nr:hypothetical protein [Azospirillum sp. B4]